MNITEFTALEAEKVEKYLREELREETRVETMETMKVNDRRLFGISILKGEEPSPTFYLNDFFHAYECGAEPDEIARDIADLYVNCMANGPQPAGEIPDMEYETVKERVGLRLLGIEYNREFLKAVPFRGMGNGYAMICDIEMDASDGGIFSTVVTNEMTERYNYDMETLFGIAFDNAWRRNPAVLMGSRELMDPKASPEEEDCYVLTAKRPQFGAAALFYPGTQAMIADVLGEDYVALPSSLHEFIIIRESRAAGPRDLQRMVREANRIVVGPDEVLSDNVLKYSRQTGMLSLISEWEDTGPARRRQTGPGQNALVYDGGHTV